MRASSPNGSIPYVWDQGTDVFDYSQLVANWDAIDALLSAARPANQVTQLGALTVGLNNTTDRGKIAYLTAPDQGYSTGTIAAWNGTNWLNTRSIEIMSALPTLNNFDGRTVLLSAGAGGFAAWTLVRYLTGSWYIVNQGIEVLASVPVSNNFAGRVVILTGASGGFNAYDVIRYDGTNWKLVGPQPIPPATELAYYSQTTDTTTTNTVSPGDTITTFSAATFENVKYYCHIAIPKITLSVAGNINFLLQETTSTVGSIMQKAVYTGGNYGETNIWMPFTPTAGSHTYNIKWYISTAGTATINSTGLAPAIFRIVKA